MITAIDTNILLDILRPNDQFADASEAALQGALADGSLVICDLVYAELCAHFPNQSECDLFLREAQIRVESITRPAAFLASRTWRQYRLSGGTREKILADFIIGAHAQHHAWRLLTRDRGFYRKMFPSLRIVEPATG